jgi:hypothetical protein
MNGRKVEELQRATGTLTQEELRLWLDEYGPSPLDRRHRGGLGNGPPEQSRPKRAARREARKIPPAIDERNIAPRKASGKPIKLSAWRNRADKQFALLKSNPQCASLQFKKVGGSPAETSARVTLNYRALALKRADGFLWCWIGDHKSQEDLI